MERYRNQRLMNVNESNKNRARLLISCPDQPGIVSAVSNFLYQQGANIVQSDQYTTDPVGGLFFMRVAFDLADLRAKEQEIEAQLEKLGAHFTMNWKISYAYRLKKMAIFVSRQEHCLLELLWQWQAGDLDMDISMVISNHQDLRPMVESLGIPFHYFPVHQENKVEVEKEQLKLLAGQVDFVVLARYMQILSPAFVQKYPNTIINIHHSFLPAFVGGKPYERAYDRGVKLIGATSHYVTNDLDQGPIIEQDIQRVNHKHNVDELKRMGRYIERIVLARAVSWHVEDRVIVHENKTVVFN